MIGRVWHGWASAENADACEDLLRSEMFAGPAARTVPGFERVELSRSDFGDEVEFMVITWFASWEAIKAFAGEEFARARVPANVRALLSRFDERSQHYEIRIRESA
jgi:heme-degrading monooxygenase HmoA